MDEETGKQIDMGQVETRREDNRVGAEDGDALVSLLRIVMNTPICILWGSAL
jgi:hypothetical protein